MGFLEIRAPTAFRPPFDGDVFGALALGSSQLVMMQNASTNAFTNASTIGSSQLLMCQNASANISAMGDSQLVMIQKNHDSHPPVGHLTILVLGAVLQVVCQSLPGYVAAVMGYFNAENQKFAANLNFNIFTPFLIFIKLAEQLDVEKFSEYALIPVIFVIQTLISYWISIFVARAFGFNRRATNFVTAMGVFGNSNSLPMSLVVSLSKTIKGLHWKAGDTDDSVAARGILYLVIFQQLGQFVRWSWGLNVLLAKKETYEEYSNHTAEEGQSSHVVQDESTPLLQGIDGDDEPEHRVLHHSRTPTNQSDDPDSYEPAGPTPVAGSSASTPDDSEDEGHGLIKKQPGRQSPIPINGEVEEYAAGGMPDGILSFPQIGNSDELENPANIQGFGRRKRSFFRKVGAKTSAYLSKTRERVYGSLPKPVQNGLHKISGFCRRVLIGIWGFMNAPLWAMLVGLLVASIPQLQDLLFVKGTFFNTSVTSAVKATSNVAIPLTLAVLGANLARNTQNLEDSDPEEQEIGTKLLIASLVSRMVLPFLIMAPILAVIAKYIQVDIMGDPIFIVVCFILAGAPSALQLAQICQMNNVYESTMGKILFQSYVIWILPSTIVLVMSALEVLEWSHPVPS